MPSLNEELRLPKANLSEFQVITERLLKYMTDMISESVLYGDYRICSASIASTRKTIRPYNFNLLIRDYDDFNKKFDVLINIAQKIERGEREFKPSDFHLVDQVIYTIQQSIGIGFDLLFEPNSARKHVGNRFEELIRALFDLLKIPNKKIILNIPYETDEGEKYYKCETDVIISPFQTVKSNSRSLHSDEIVISLKTTTKDRMPKIFIDKILMEKFLGHPVRVLGISQNDIQRKDNQKKAKISSTFVSNLFMVYTKFLTELEGYYYLDIPRKAKEQPFNQYIFPFSKLILHDLWKLLVS